VEPDIINSLVYRLRINNTSNQSEWEKSIELLPPCFLIMMRLRSSSIME